MTKQLKPHNFPTLSDSNLVELVRNGGGDSDGEWAAEQLYKRHGPKLVGLAYKKIGDLELAEWVVNIAFSEVLTRNIKQPNFRDESISQYLRTRVISRCCNSLREFDHSAHIIAETKQAHITHPPQITEPEREFLYQETISEVDSAIREMPSKRSACMHLFIIEELTAREIAARLTLSLAAVLQHISRGRSDLRRRLTPSNRKGIKS